VKGDEAKSKMMLLKKLLYDLGIDYTDNRSVPVRLSSAP